MTDKNSIKSNLQEEALNSWVNHGEVGLLLLFTGFGKTKLAVDAIKREKELNKTSKILIITPSTNLRDINWVDQIIQWGAGQYMPDITIECVQTAHKWNTADYDLLILDEVHRYLSDEFKKVHYFGIKKVMALTATAPNHDDDKMNLLEDLYKVVYKKTLQDGIDLGIVSPFKVFNLALNFTKRERAMYNVYQDQFNSHSRILNDYIKVLKNNNMPVSFANSFELAKIAKKDKEHPMHESAEKYWKAMTMRKWVCHNAYYKISTIKRIVEKFNDKKWIVFSESTKFVDRVDKELDNSVKYHSKLSSNDKELALQKIKLEETRTLITVKALSEGYDLPAMDAAISASGNSVESRMWQELGRIVRLKEGKQAIFINLFIKDTQDEIWVKSKTSSMEPIYTNSINEIYEEMYGRE